MSRQPQPRLDGVAGAFFLALSICFFFSQKLI
jgi:hypothetical protein